MRFYPTTDVNFFYDIPPSWKCYCRTPRKSWKRKPPLEPLHTMFVYRDLEGAAIKTVLRKHLYFSEEWQKTRVRNDVCLPMDYGVGSHYILLERAPPLRFKCSPMPINLKEVQAVNAYYRKLAKEKARLRKLQRRAELEAKKKKKKK